MALLEDDTILLERLRLAIKTQHAGAVLFSAALNMFYMIARGVNLTTPGFLIECYLQILKQAPNVSEILDKPLEALR